MEQLMNDPSMKNMFMVNDDSTDELKTEFFETMKETDALCEVVDPDATPYLSKYKAREKLDKLIQKLSAAQTIASLEKKKQVVQDMASRVAACEVRIGTISYECEEPHNAETELHRAAAFYCEGFVEKVTEMCADAQVHEDQTELMPDEKKPVEKFDKSWFPPAITLTNAGEYIDAIKCLNMIGILWAGRGMVKKSHMYLLSAKIVYHSTKSAGVPAPFRKASAIKSGGAHAAKVEVASAAVLEELESLYTHTLFYLAQSYGNMGEVEMSCRYCHETLRRQLKKGFDTPKAAAEWAKNATSLSDFYLSMGFYVRCYLSISAANKILHDKVVNVKAASSIFNTPNNLLDTWMEQEADIKRRLARLDLILLKKVFDKEHSLEQCKENGFERDEIDMQEYHMDAIKEEQYVDYDPEIERKNYEIAVKEAGHLPTAPSSAASSSLSSSSLEEVAMPPKPPSTESLSSKATGGGVSESGVGVEVTTWEAKLHRDFFPDNSPLVPFLKVEDILNYESARSVFLRAVTNIEASKVYYKLDGFVTDHVMLLQDHSKLFHYLTVFETDSKRKLAMETRRMEMLKPLLSSLNKSSFENLHKQLSFELGEIYQSLLETKLDKLRTRGGDEIDVRSLKKAEITNCNSYAQGALTMYLYFASLYLPTGVDNSKASAGGGKSSPYAMPLQEMTLQQLTAVPLQDPDFSLISEDEIRPFLNSHFLACRALTKVIVPPDAERTEHVLYISSAHKRYEWLWKMTKTLCEKKKVEIKDVFDAEYKLSEEMKNLLPAKIDRIYYRGESGLLL